MFTEGLKNMLFDIFHIIKMAVTTKMGISLTLLCAFIYFMSLLITGGFKTSLLVLTLLSIFGFLIMSYFTWFSRSSQSQLEEDENED